MIILVKLDIVFDIFNRFKRMPKCHRLRRFPFLSFHRKCCEEAAIGDKRRADYVVINVEAMKKSVLIHPVTLLELAELETRLAEPDRIDPGEKHLLAHALKKAAVWHVSASDRAAVNAGSELGLLRQVPNARAAPGCRTTYRRRRSAVAGA
jgi:hypothetical protein